MSEDKVNCLAGRSCLPSTAVIEMTYRCNHQCLYCSCPWEAPASAPHDPYPKEAELSTEKWKSILTDLTTKHDCCHLAFTGGETLLKEGLEELLRHAASLKARFPVVDDGPLHFEDKTPEIYVLSNGRLMSEKWLDLFAELKVHLSLSLPGLSAFEAHTGHDTSAQVLSWMKKASAREIPVTANVTVTKKNLRELFETLSQAFLHGADMLLMNRFMPGGRGLAYADELVLSAEEVLQMCEVADEVLQLSNRPGSLGTELPLCVLKGKTFEKLQVGTRCSAAKEFFVLDPSGWIRCCNHSPIRIVHWDEVHTLAEHPYWRRFVERDYLPDPCFECSLMTECDGGCREAAHVQKGSVTAADPLWDPSMIVRD